MLHSLDLIAILTIVLSIVGCQASEQTPEVVVKEAAESVPPIESFGALDYKSETVVHHDVNGRVKVQVDSAWTKDGLLIVRGQFTPDGWFPASAGMTEWSAKSPACRALASFALRDQALARYSRLACPWQ